MDYYSGMKKNEITPLVDLEIILVKSEKNKYH